MRTFIEDCEAKIWQRSEGGPFYRAVKSLLFFRAIKEDFARMVLPAMQEELSRRGLDTIEGVNKFFSDPSYSWFPEGRVVVASALIKAVFPGVLLNPDKPSYPAHVTLGYIKDPSVELIIKMLGVMRRLPEAYGQVTCPDLERKVKVFANNLVVHLPDSSTAGLQAIRDYMAREVGIGEPKKRGQANATEAKEAPVDKKPLGVFTQPLSPHISTNKRIPTTWTPEELQKGIAEDQQIVDGLLEALRSTPTRLQVQFGVDAFFGDESRGVNAFVNFNYDVGTRKMRTLLRY